MANSILLKALGLKNSLNLLDTAPGSLTTASNVEIPNQNLIRSRRGYKLFGTALPSGFAKQLITYKERILRHSSDILEYDSGNVNPSGVEIFNQFGDTVTEVEPGLRIKSVEANGNLYFTTNEGVKKISAVTAKDFTTSPGFITKAGGVKAIDFTAVLDYQSGDSTGFLQADSACAYRIVWGTKDLNNNLILGVPSNDVQVFNGLNNLTINDFNNTLQAIDNTRTVSPQGILNANNYVSTLALATGSTPAEVLIQLIALASKLDNNITYTSAVAAVSSQRVTTSEGRIVFASTMVNYIRTGDFITFSSSVTPDLNGKIGLVTDVTTTTVTFTPTIDFAATDGSPVSDAGLVVNSYNYRELTAPPTPNIIPTHGDLAAQQAYLSQIITLLKNSLPGVINATAITDFISGLFVTTSANVLLTIDIPQDITVNYFVQIYRSEQITASNSTDVLGTDLVPTDELAQVYEAYITPAELAVHQVVVEDIVLDSFLGANLYTNASSGVGIAQANDIPPLCRDIALFQNYTFFANTSTKQQLNLSLLGITKLIADYNMGDTPSITISSAISSFTYTFVVGLPEISNVTAVADISNSLNGKYFTLASANSLTPNYYVWYKTSGGTAIDPMIAGATGIQVFINTGDSASQVAADTQDALNVLSSFFTATATGSGIVITNIENGYASTFNVGTSGFTLNSSTSGRGESASLHQVLLSNSPSPAIAVTETTQSLIRVINENLSEIVYGYYLSSPTGAPGVFLLEAKELIDPLFYVVANNTDTGTSFSPSLAPTNSIVGIMVSNPAIVTSTAHGLVTNDQIVISGTNSIPSANGLWSVTVTGPNTFTIPLHTTFAGTGGAFILASEAVFSDNATRPNRIYYSQFQQPEAVAILNFLELGGQDKAILRIFTLRDSLFAFKEDGLFRISGSVAPFSFDIFDNSCIVTAIDSLALVNNYIYAWTTQGISMISEGGVAQVSDDIRDDLLQFASSNYPNFGTVTWGVGYESDKAYIVFTNSSPSDTVATQAFRFSSLTNTWTTWSKTNTCGIVNDGDNKLYLGAGDVSFIEQERKALDRTDYADREYDFNLGPGELSNDGLTISLSSVENISVGDVLVQYQSISIYDFNALLQKLDNDPGITTKTYFTTLAANPGDNMRTKLAALATRLDSDLGGSAFSTIIANESGTITQITKANPTVVTSSASTNLITTRVITITGSDSTPSIDGDQSVTVTGSDTFTVPINVTIPGTTGSWITDIESYADIQACYNLIIGLLNINPIIFFNNYLTINYITQQESIITNVNTNTLNITINLALQYEQGPFIIYKAIPTTVVYAPYTAGDQLSLKHFRQSSIMFLNKAFTSAVLSFATDLLPALQDIPFNGDGNGIFGNDNFGTIFFGGSSHGAPFRTYVPRDCQRCRYLLIQFFHQIAREEYLIFGITVTGEISSERAYR